MHGGPLTGLVRLDVAQAVARDARHRREVGKIEGVVRVGAQVRAHGEEYAATAWAEGDRVEVRLDSRIRGVAPGQSVVLYDGTRVVGSATIAASRLERTSESRTSEPGAVSSGTGST